MIKSFKDKETEKIFDGEFSKRLPTDIQKQALKKLIKLDSVYDVLELRKPASNNLEALKGSRLGEYSIRINKQFRICFTFKNHNAYNVEIVDYH